MADKECLKVGVLGSGKGSNCQAIIDAAESGSLNARVVCVASDVEDAYILERAAGYGIPASFISAAPFKTKLEGEGEARFVEFLREHDVQVVALAGFMRVIKPGLLAAFPGKVINIHPSLLPSFPGLHGWEQTLDYGAKVGGCTVHIVDEGVDTGPIIVQKAVPVMDDDTAESLHARIQIQEHIAYPEALAIMAAGNYRLEGRRLVQNG